MTVLQAKQAGLLSDLDQSEGLSREAVIELCQDTDLAHCATKQIVHGIFRSMTSMVATEQHLWLNLLGIKGKRTLFVLRPQSHPLTSSVSPEFPTWSHGIYVPRYTFSEKQNTYQ